MTKLMEEAIRRVADLPNDQQDAVAAIVLAELESEDRWDKAFAESQDLLKELGAEAIALDEKGKTSSLDRQQGLRPRAIRASGSSRFTSQNRSSRPELHGVGEP